MAQPVVSFPKQWEDWTSWVLGIWLLLSPWVLWFEKDATAMHNAVVVGLLIILAELIELSIFRDWEEWINVALGVWLIISPWALRTSDAAAKINFLVVGVLVLVLAVHELWNARARGSHSEPNASR
ncbi:MAG: SPW repeat protein [Xanthobacteraceae bacterium]